MSDLQATSLPKCVLCGFNDGHNEWCDRNPAKGQPIEYQLARVACAITVPKGFAQCVDGTDGMRVGTNVASVEEWRQFFVTFLAQGVLQTEQPESAMHVEIADCSMYGKPSEKPGFYTVTMQTDPGEIVKLRLGEDARKALRDVLTVGGDCESLEIVEQAQGHVCDVCGKKQAKDPYAYCQGHGEPA